MGWNLPAHEPSVSWILAWSLHKDKLTAGPPGRILTIHFCLQSLLLSQQATTSPEEAGAVCHFRALLFLPAQNQPAVARDANSYRLYRCSPAEPAPSECRAGQPGHGREYSRAHQTPGWENRDSLRSLQPHSTCLTEFSVSGNCLGKIVFFPELI